MKTSLSEQELARYVKKQIEIFMPDGYGVNEQHFLSALKIALDRCEGCFKHILVPGYHNEKEVLFSHLHMDQYATFLYFLGNTLWVEYKEKEICDRLLNLNRILNGFFLSYKCPMPNIFILAHPVGTIIGNALYSDGLYISQNVTINTHTDEKNEIDLRIGKGCFLGAGAKIIGNKPIGDRVSIGVDALIYDREVKDDSVCIRNPKGEMVIEKRKKEKCMASRVFDLDFT